MTMPILIISALFGFVIFFAVFAAFRIFNDIPKEDRSFLDRPPVGFRLGWPLVKLIAHYLGGFLSEAYVYTTNKRLTYAGVNYTLSAQQFFAGKILGAIFGALFCFLAQKMLGKDAPIYIIVAFIVGFYYPEIWLKETTDLRNNKIFRSLPFFLDVITLAVESGSNLTSGINQAVQKAPDGPLRVELSRVLRDVRSGKPRAEALRGLSDRISSSGVANVVAGMIQAEKTGASLGPVLRAQSDQLRSARFLKAEKLGMEAPVKLLGPLVMFIFPTTFLVIMFVMLSQALQEDLFTWAPLVWAFNNPK
jgi:tight adherence protein C